MFPDKVIKTLNEVFTELLKQEIERRQELRQRAQEAMVQRQESEARAAREALVLIQDQAGFTLDGWAVEVEYLGLFAEGDHFSVSLVKPSGHDFSHRVEFSSHLVNSNGQFQLPPGKMEAFHIENSAGKCETLRGSGHLLEALAWAEFGDLFGLEGEKFDKKVAGILESLNGATES